MKSEGMKKEQRFSVVPLPIAMTGGETDANQEVLVLRYDVRDEFGSVSHLTALGLDGRLDLSVRVFLGRLSGGSAVASDGTSQERGDYTRHVVRGLNGVVETSAWVIFGISLVIDISFKRNRAE